jgi:hypothetical protein
MAESTSLFAVQEHLQIHPPLLETRKNFIQFDIRKTTGDSAKQILIGQRVRSTNWRPDK